MTSIVYTGTDRRAKSNNPIDDLTSGGFAPFVAKSTEQIATWILATLKT